MSDQAPGAVLRGAVDLSSLRNRANQSAAPASAPSGCRRPICLAVCGLPVHHRDPFDRLIVA